MNTSRKASRVALAAAVLLTTAFVCWTNLWSSHAQKAAPPPPSQKKPVIIDDAPAKPTDYSQEAVVIEQLKSTYRFERNGTGQREMEVKVKVQSEAGLERFGQLVFPYSSSSENLNIDYVRVRKADGAQVSAQPTDIQDLTAPVAREAPVYTDLRQKHVTVPGLRPGDSLEYHVTWAIHTPLAENHFWLEHDFVSRDVIVLNDELEVNIPSASNVKLKLEPGFDPAIKEQDGRRLYSWKHANLKIEDKDKESPTKTEDDDPPKEPKPDVQITTFQTWDEVGQWYAALQRDRVVPDNRIRAKAEELVRGRTSEKEKIQALYEYVAKNFRYVSLSFGQGRYQPHGAAEVLTNEYGDCKDKHTLFSAMLNATGVQAYPVLINSARKIDPDVPSPAQFDHVITAIPIGTETLWADTTAEVAPFRLLAPPLRNKKGLLVPVSGAAHLESTPAEPPFVFSETINLEGTVSELGKLSLHARLVLRGDAEMYFRLAFRKTPKSNWKDLGYFLATIVGVPGNVVGITPSDPADLSKPFELEFDLTSDNFLDWSSKKLKVEIPLPNMQLQLPKRKSKEPIELGAPINIAHNLKLTLPAKYQARVPLPLAVTRDYADYRSNYKIENNTLTADRSLQLRRREIPFERVNDYQAFVSAAQSDEAQTLALETNVAGTPTIPDSVKNEDLIHTAEVALRNENYATAEQLLKRVLQNDPKEKEIRRSLAYALYGQQKVGEAIGVLKEQTEINPFDDYSFGLLGRVYWQQQKYTEAEAAFRKQLEIKPLDESAHANLGQMLVQWRKFKEAVPELEKAISLNPENANLQVSLGRAYLSLGETQKGIAAMEEAVKLDPSQGIWNDVAYFMAVHNVQLEKAQQYAESAVTAVATQLRNVDLQNLKMDDLNDVQSLVAFWDTLGWVHFQKGDVDVAERYISAAWAIEQHSEVGYHLGRIAEKRGNTEQAISLYAQAAIAPRVVPEAAEALERLAGKPNVAARLKKADEELPKPRPISLGTLLQNVTQPTEAEFYIAFVPDASRKAQIADVKFIGGSDKLKGVAEQLKTLRYEFTFPADSPTKIIRRGALLCIPKPGACTFTMLNPDSVTSVN